MSESLSRAEVAEVANLALLDLSDSELDAFTEQLGAVLEHAKDIEALDVGDVAPTHHPYPLVNVFRADEVELAGGNGDGAVGDGVRDAVLASAPEAEDGQFRVPPALGEEP